MKIFENPNRLRRAAASGFRVVALVALLGAGGGGWWYLNDLSNPTPEELEAEKSMARANVVNDMVPIRAALRAYKDDNGAYPTSEEGLAALVKAEEITEEKMKDRFGNPYEYKGPANPAGLGADGEFQLFSAGPDGVPVTADDISSAAVASEPKADSGS